MRIWFKIWKSNHLVKDMTIEKKEADTRTHKVFQALEEACAHFNLSVPIWLDATVADFKRYAKARFNADNFIGDIDFDYLEIQVLKED